MSTVERRLRYLCVPFAKQSVLSVMKCTCCVLALQSNQAVL